MIQLQYPCGILKHSLLSNNIILRQVLGFFDKLLERNAPGAPANILSCVSILIEVFTGHERPAARINDFKYVFVNPPNGWFRLKVKMDWPGL